MKTNNTATNVDQIMLRDAGLKVKTRMRAGHKDMGANHNETARGLRVKTALKAGHLGDGSV